MQMTERSRLRKWREEDFVRNEGIGQVPDQAQTVAFRQLLTANLFWGETCGCTMTYEPLAADVN